MTDESKTERIDLPGGYTIRRSTKDPARWVLADSADIPVRTEAQCLAFASALRPTPAPVAGLDEIERLVDQAMDAHAKAIRRVVTECFSSESLEKIWKPAYAARAALLDAIHALARDAGKVPDELRKLSDAAAGGVWFHEETDTRKRQYHIRSTLGQDTGGSGMRLFGGIQSEETASFVAAAVNFVRSLIASTPSPKAEDVREAVTAERGRCARIAVLEDWAQVAEDDGNLVQAKHLRAHVNAISATPDQPQAEPSAVNVLRDAWKAVGEHGGITIEAVGDDAATTWNALCHILDPLVNTSTCDLARALSGAETGQVDDDRERNVFGEIALSLVSDRINKLEADLATWKGYAEDRADWYQTQLARATTAESALTAAEARIGVLEAALKPFAQADRAIGKEPGPFRFETGTGHRLIERDDLARAGTALSVPEKEGTATPPSEPGSRP